jgi:integrase
VAKTLTAARIEKLRPTTQRREIADCGCQGLYLIIQSSGVKSFALRARRPNGTNFKLTLGRYTPIETDGAPAIGAPLTLHAARQLAIELMRERARGVDVAGRRRIEKLSIATGDTKTFAGAVVDFVTQYAKPKQRNWKESARFLGIYPETLDPIKGGLCDRWRDRALAETTDDDLFALLEEVRQHGTPGVTRQRVEGASEARAAGMFATLSKFYSWALEKRRLKTNPMAALVRPKAPKSRDRVLSDAEIVALWKAAEAERIEFAAPLKLLLLTGCRAREIAELRWNEIGGDWNIELPGARTKNHRDHIVPLSPLAREILADVDQVGEYVFSAHGGRVPVELGGRLKDRLDAAMGLDDWVFHDLRRTAATGMAKIGIAPHIVEAVLNHVSGAKAGVAGVYNKYAYLPEKKAALERWAAHVEGLITGTAAKVVSMVRS